MLFRYLYVVLSNKRPQLFSDYLIKSFSCLESPYKVVATLVESKSFMKYCTLGLQKMKLTSFPQYRVVNNANLRKI